MNINLKDAALAKAVMALPKNRNGTKALKLICRLIPAHGEDMKNVFVMLLALLFVYNASAETDVVYKSLVQEIVVEPTERQALIDADDATQTAVSIFLRWFLGGGKNKLPQELGKKQIYLSCGMNGAALLVGYFSGDCTAFSVEKRSSDYAISAMLLDAKAIRVGPAVASMLDHSKKILEGIPTLTVKGAKSVEEVPGVYARVATSLVIGKVTWGMARIGTTPIGMYLDGQIEALDLGAIFGELIRYVPVNAPVTFHIK